MSSLRRISKVQFVCEKWSSLGKEIAFSIDLQPKGELANGKRYESVGSGEVMNTPQIRGRSLSICAAATVAFPHSHHLKLFSVFFLSFFSLHGPFLPFSFFFLIFHFPVPPFFIHPHTYPPPPPILQSPHATKWKGLFWRCFEVVDRLSFVRSRGGKGSVICRSVGQES